MPLISVYAPLGIITTNSQSNLTKGASPPHMDGSIVFARWRHMHPRLIYGSLGPPESTCRTSRLVQPFCTAHCRRFLYGYYTMDRLFSRQACPFARGIWAPSNTWFLWVNRVHNPNGISISFLQGSLLWQTDRQTDNATWSINNRPHLHT